MEVGINMFEADHGILRVMCKRDIIDIPIESIYYIESDGRKLNIHRSDEICITIYGKLNDMEQVLEKAWQKQDEHRNRFLRCHQSYLVGERHIQGVYPGYLLVQGKKISITRKYALNVSQRQENIVNEIKMAHNEDSIGIIKGVNGKYQGAVITIYPNKKIWIGRNPEQSDIVVQSDDVSRKHCSVTYLGQNQGYLVEDCSQNGTFVLGGPRLRPDEENKVPEGVPIYLGSQKNIFQLM